jgi:hypothetical protein
VIDGYVYGQRVDRQGNLLGARFTIYDQSGGTWPHDAYEPDVACHWGQDRFVVVWTVDYYNSSEYKIVGQAVYGAHQASGSQLHGSHAYVAWSGDTDRQHPAVACNDTDNTCLVAFDYGECSSSDVYGQRVSLWDWGLNPGGDAFNISNFGAEEHNPDVAWGGEDDAYAVVWEYLQDTGLPTEHYRTVFALVWDTSQAPDPEIKKGGTYLISPGTYDSNQAVPVVAYNPAERQFLVLFNYDWNGDGSDWDVYAHRLEAASGAPVGSPFSVSASIVQERAPAVAFNGGTSMAGKAHNGFLATHVVESGGEFILYGRSIIPTPPAAAS